MNAQSYEGKFDLVSVCTILAAQTLVLTWLFLVYKFAAWYFPTNQ